MEIIYNIKLMKENTLLITKITFKHIFCFTYSICLFINSTKHVFFIENKKCFPEFSSQTQFFFLFSEDTKNYS